MPATTRRTTSASARPATAPADRLGPTWPVLLCWLVVALDGFDLVVIGAVIPTLSATGDLGFTDASLTTASTLGLVGVGIGAALVGPVSDRLGRRRTLISCVAWFSVLTVATAWAPSVGVFTTFRFLAGLGLGACLPTALALMSELAPAARNGTAMTRVMTGYHVGAVLTALLALVVIDPWGWQAMFVIGGVAGLLTLPLLYLALPESAAFLRADTEHVQPTQVLQGRYLRVSIGLWVASFMGLLLVYGLNTWLPKLMGEAGYSIEAGTTLLLVLNLGAVIGLLVAGRISDRRGNKPTVLVWFGVAAACLALLSIRIENELLVLAAVLVTGIFVFSAQVLVYAFVGHLYPPEIRGTALGLAAGIGRIGAIVGPSITGALVTAGVAYPWGFYVFAGAAVLAVLALLTVPAHPSEPAGVPG
ncbi:MFS transporter [Nocardioides sp.]|uniref:MFS transporter n=1 Tax=Nocardioides sp. TaxID=35761 RepID=UPI0037835736